MNRRKFLQAGMATVAVVAGERSSSASSPLAASAPVPPPVEEVNFGYAFAPPHRMTVARPEASEKTLLDLDPGVLSMSWSYDDLRKTPLAIFKPPKTEWRIKLQPLLDGKPFADSRWKRTEDILPVLENKYREPRGSVQLEILGGATAALTCVKVQNTDSSAHRFSVLCEVINGWVAHNPAWMEPGKNPDALVACQADRPDRILLFGLGAEEFPVGAKTMTLEWTLQPGEIKTGWIVRPYAAYEQELEQLRTRDWKKEFESSKEEWRVLLSRAVAIQIPDAAVLNAFYACLGDLFIMREPLADGYMGTLAGNLLKRTDAASNVTCTAYDQLHRPTAITYPSGTYSSSTDKKYYVYDSATVGGSTMQNAKTRLAQAYTCPPTGSCTTKKTDEGFSYSDRGDLTDTYQATPHSGATYYHVTATPWANGALHVLSSNISGLPTQTYAADGEGRISTVSAGSGQNPVTAATYNPASQLTAITLGSSDNDAFTFDPNTGRMTQYKYNVGTGPVKTVQGDLTWNSNGTLQQLGHHGPVKFGQCANLQLWL